MNNIQMVCPTLSVRLVILYKVIVWLLSVVVVVSGAPGPVRSLPHDVGDNVTPHRELAAQLRVSAAVEKTESSCWRGLTDPSSDYRHLPRPTLTLSSYLS